MFLYHEAIIVLLPSPRRDFSLILLCFEKKEKSVVAVDVYVVVDDVMMMMTVASFGFFYLQDHLPSWQLKEDAEFVLTRTFDFHKFAENYSTHTSTQRWSKDSNELPEDFVLSKSPDPLSRTADSDCENEDEIFLVFRGKPNSHVSSFDECQATAGKVVNVEL